MTIIEETHFPKPAMWVGMLLAKDFTWLTLVSPLGGACVQCTKVTYHAAASHTLLLQFLPVLGWDSFYQHSNRYRKANV